MNDRTFSSSQYARLSAAQCQKLHWASLEVLERTGVQLFEPAAVELLKHAGASVAEENRVRIPSGMVEKALTTAPKRTDVAPEKFVEMVRSAQPDIVTMSALLTTTMPNMQATIKALEKAGLRGQVKVIVGGAPLTEKFARQIGADGFAPDAGRAVALAKSLMS